MGLRGYDSATGTPLPKQIIPVPPGGAVAAHCQGSHGSESHELVEKSGAGCALSLGTRHLHSFMRRLKASPQEAVWIW